MGLAEELKDHIKQAMKARQADRLSALRLIKTELDRAALDRNKDLSDAETQELLARMCKQRREAAEQFLQGDRPELAAREEAELVIVAEFMPPALTPEQIDAIIDEVLAKAGEPDPAQTGRLIGQVMGALKAAGGTFDGKAVNTRIRERLSS